MGILIYIILRGLSLVNEWKAIINLQNDMVKNIQNLTTYIKKKSINFGFEKVGLLQLKAGRGVTIATNSRMEMGEHNHGLCNRITKEQKW